MIFDREAAAKRAEAAMSNVPGTCQTWTRLIFGAPAVGDVDGDGDADAVDGWLSEPLSARRIDKNPPRGVPVSWAGGSRGYGHRAVSLGGGKVRSTDMKDGRYNPGTVGTATIEQVTRSMGLRYLGWSTTISGMEIPMPPKPPKPSKKASLRRIVSWNVQVGRKKKRVRRGLRKTIKANNYPVAVSVQEGRGYRRQIAGVAKHQRYNVFQPEDVQKAYAQIRGSGHTVLMIHKDVQVTESGELRMTTTWRGPKGRTQEGRVFPWVKAQIQGRPTLIVAVHMPWGRNKKGNRAAWDETLAALRTLAKGFHGDVIMIGDWNMSPVIGGKRSIKRLAKDIGGKIIHAGGIDYAVVRNIDGEMTKGAFRGSDHRVIRLRRK